MKVEKIRSEAIMAENPLSLVLDLLFTKIGDFSLVITNDQIDNAGGNV